MGGKKFQPLEYPLSRSKAKDVKEKKRGRLKIGNNNGQLRIANATSGGARKAAWAKNKLVSIIGKFDQNNFILNCLYGSIDTHLDSWLITGSKFCNLHPAVDSSVTSLR